MLSIALKKRIGTFDLDIHFKASSGLHALVGPSGCGKSLTLRCIAGINTPDSGKISLDGYDLFNSVSRTNVPSRKRGVGFVAQHYALFPHLTVLQNVTYGLSGLPLLQRLERARDMLRRMHILPLEKRYPSQLSGGQQQRVALARTLVTNPQILLLDEPFAALDTIVRDDLEQECIGILKTVFGGITLLVTHDIEQAYRLCDHITVLNKGRAVRSGTREDVIDNPGSIAAARITGCHNLFPVQTQPGDSGFVQLSCKSLSLRMPNPAALAPGSHFCGIRSHHLKLSSQAIHPQNSFPCAIINKVIGVFSTKVMVQCGEMMFNVEVSNADCPHLAKCPRGDRYLYFPPEKLFLVSQESM